MAFNRDFLKSLGLTEKEALDSAMQEHGDVIEDTKNKAQGKYDTLKTKYDNDTEALKSKNETLQSKLNNAPKPDPDGKDWKSEYETLKNSIKPGDGEEWKAKFEQIQGEFDTYKTNTENEKTTMAKQSALRKHLADDKANPKLSALVEKAFDLSKIELDGDNIKDWENLSKPVKEQYADVFTTINVKGHEPASNPPHTPENDDLFLKGFDS